MSEFTVEIVRPDKLGMGASASLELPATWAEFQDAMQQARITDDTAYTYELCYVERDWLRPHIPEESADLLELNLLATRMEKYIKDNMGVFEAMVQIEGGRHDGEPIPLPRLINMTFSLDECPAVADIRSDKELGEFLYKNDFFTKEDAEAIQARLDSGRPVNDLYAILAREHRANTGGVLTDSGRYVEFDGSTGKAYVPGETEYFERTGAPVVLELSKNGKTAIYELPMESPNQR
ncbi:MAG: hypothetical protein LBD23_16000, partial [Oscillospiraceae bacterium]|nr:hypothetical protein [Oscillospiraceae bacterium]